MLYTLLVLFLVIMLLNQVAFHVTPLVLALILLVLFVPTGLGYRYYR